MRIRIQHEWCSRTREERDIRLETSQKTRRLRHSHLSRISVANKVVGKPVGVIFLSGNPAFRCRRGLIYEMISEVASGTGEGQICRPCNNQTPRCPRTSRFPQNRARAIYPRFDASKPVRSGIWLRCPPQRRYQRSGRPAIEGNWVEQRRVFSVIISQASEEDSRSYRCVNKVKNQVLAYIELLTPFLTK